MTTTTLTATGITENTITTLAENGRKMLTEAGRVCDERFNRVAGKAIRQMVADAEAAGKACMLTYTGMVFAGQALAWNTGLVK